MSSGPTTGNDSVVSAGFHEYRGRCAAGLSGSIPGGGSSSGNGPRSMALRRPSPPPFSTGNPAPPGPWSAIGWLAAPAHPRDPAPHLGTAAAG